MNTTPQPRVQFSAADSPEGRVQKLAQSYGNLDARILALETKLSQLAAQRQPALKTDPSGNVVLDGFNGSAGLLRRDKSGKLNLYQPLEVTEWRDYFAQCNPQGWAAVNGNLYYCRIGTMMYVEYDILGTSNAVNAQVELPYPLRDLGNLYVPLRAIDNGIVQVQCGMAVMGVGSNVLEFYPNMPAGNWNIVGDKGMSGELFYRIAV